MRALIRAGRLVHQGSVGELRAAQQPQFIVAPERDADLRLLAGLLQEAGCTVTERPAESAVLVEAPGFGAADLNRAQVASEYSLGTLRQLLVRQPRRAVLLGGKMLGTITFLVLALCFAAVVALIVAVAAAQSRHVPTSAWSPAPGSVTCSASWAISRSP